MKHSLAICLLLITNTSHADISKWADAEGKVHYSDTPSIDYKVKTMKSTAAHGSLMPASGVAIPKTLAEREVEWKKSQKSKEEAAQKAAKEQEAASIKQKNCENARGNLKTLENTPVLVTYNSNGERAIIDDATRKQKADEARQAVTSYCS